MFIDPILPKLSFAKLTSEVPSGLIFTLSLVPFMSRDIVGSSIIIDPLSCFEIFPDSIMTDPKSTFPKKILSKPKISNSITSKEDDSFTIIVE